MLGPQLVWGILSGPLRQGGEGKREAGGDPNHQTLIFFPKRWQSRKVASSTEWGV